LTNRGREAGGRSGVALRASASVALLATGVVLAACSGEQNDRLTKRQYEQKVQSVYGHVQASFRELGRNAGSLQDLAASVKSVQSALRDAADELEAIEPPETVEEENEELVEGMRGYADDLDRLREAAADENAPGVQTFNAAIAENDSIERMAEAAEEMMHHGYDLGPLKPE
jgi:methyl-accepting chemotaxis protein